MGLTLIELTVAMVIVAVLFSAAVVGAGAITGSRARAAVGELAGTIRSLYDTAALSGKTCRLVMDLGPSDKAEELEYRAECAEGAVARGEELADPKDGRDRDRERKPDKNQEEKALGAELAAALPFPAATDAPTLEDLSARERDRVETAAKYSAFTSPEVRPRKLSGLRVSVWTQGAARPVTHGLAYLYFFPQGYTERAQVVVEQGDNAWTLRISPLSGKTTVVAGALEAPR